MSDKGYANPELLISAQELNAQLHSGDLCIVDTRPTHAFVAGHIPGAIHLDIYGISLNDTREQAFEAFMAMFRYLMHSRGIGTDKTVVWYEDNSGMRAARGFWICEYLGHSDVRVLDGGFHAWNAAGFEVTSVCVEVEGVDFESEALPELHMGADTLQGLLGRDDVIPLDTRSDDEYFGRAVRAARGGAIPGAVHIEYVNNLDETGAFKPADELRAMYESAGITPEKEIVPY
jgi:thiosulfate/3-mercaptopyruvate sulfurtransferase